MRLQASHALTKPGRWYAAGLCSASAVDADRRRF